MYKLFLSAYILMNALEFGKFITQIRWLICRNLQITPNDLIELLTQSGAIEEYNVQNLFDAQIMNTQDI